MTEEFGTRRKSKLLGDGEGGIFLEEDRGRWMKRQKCWRWRLAH